ncbi:hypothetical protein L198_05222 [Cryptococcus wingfieldii CBS 7118]|uniref:Uncharacterized protein n=1 Tax=Cryptococcus wingfieldii CBS 7118 TaxID=1295528 RepID=A0A1E3J0F8_9TREE|nr:hypothetical protein L198_05222 [Cryptococcus wingfieldii CBS 7118]ODN94363.1 hypothetical protein L198_05222 [Cryptococcus wingfieldii CBS 7118]
MATAPHASLANSKNRANSHLRPRPSRSTLIGGHLRIASYKQTGREQIALCGSLSHILVALLALGPRPPFLLSSPPTNHVGLDPLHCPFPNSSPSLAVFQRLPTLSISPFCGLPSPWASLSDESGSTLGPRTTTLGHFWPPVLWRDLPPPRAPTSSEPAVSVILDGTGHRRRPWPRVVVRGPSVDPLSSDNDAHYEAGFHSLHYLPDDVVLSVAFNIEGCLMDRGGKRAGLEWTPSTIIVHGRVADDDSSTDSSPAKQPDSSPAKRPRQEALSADVLLGKTPVKKAKTGSTDSLAAGSPSASSSDDVFGGPEPLRKSKRSRKGKEKEDRDFVR